MGENISQANHVISISGIFHEGLVGQRGSQHHTLTNTDHVSESFQKLLHGDLFHNYQEIIIVRVSIYTLLEDIASY